MALPQHLGGSWSNLSPISRLKVRYLILLIIGVTDLCKKLNKYCKSGLQNSKELHSCVVFSFLSFTNFLNVCGF